jgi:hypothetical protein
MVGKIQLFKPAKEKIFHTYYNFHCLKKIQRTRQVRNESIKKHEIMENHRLKLSPSHPFQICDANKISQQSKKPPMLKFQTPLKFSLITEITTKKSIQKKTFS